jgi:GT2 family glycosyltransferase
VTIAAVVIGRNEGARLIACLDSLSGHVDKIIYVDSGSTDGSREAAAARGAKIVRLDSAFPFTAARARNAGVAALEEEPEFIQFIDGDCALRSGWIAEASAFLRQHPKVAVVCGRRRERHPDASVYNRLIDREWNSPPGPAKACGGDALMRRDAFLEVDGYRDTLIAGEEPELCLRLRAAGWRIHRLDAEMTWHDAEIHRFGQWWRRTLRAGHAFAEGAALHGAGRERHWVVETRRALLWGAVLPVLTLLAVLLAGPIALLLLLIYPAQVLRLARRHDITWAIFIVLGRFAEALGALRFYLRRRPSGIIEYK